MSCCTEHSITGKLHTLMQSDLDWFSSCTTDIAYDDIFHDIEGTSNVDTCIDVRRNSEAVHARLASKASEGVPKSCTDVCVKNFRYTHLARPVSKQLGYKPLP